VCLIARNLEELGIATVAVGSALDILQAGQPPRAVFVDYPLGHSVGRPFDADNQRMIVNAALDAFETIRTPGSIIELDCRWSDDDSWQREAADTNSGDTRAPRDETPQYQSDDDRLAAEKAGARAG
jgi:hypothetical protein